jgi:hypothetical protein
MSFTLKGLTGVIVGFIGLLMTIFIYLLTDTYGDGFDGPSQLPIALLEIAVMVIVLVFILMALLMIWLKGKIKAKKQKRKLWSPLEKKLRVNTLVMILLFTIGLMLIAHNGYYSFLTPVSLLFYALLLMNLNRLSSGNLKYLALAEIILAIFAYFIYDKEILFLGIGFGLFQILYGVFSINKNKKATVN